ncbi:MAG: hypothetical protein ACRESS_11830 [Stenotrophobium sp.]
MAQSFNKSDEFFISALLTDVGESFRIAAEIDSPTNRRNCVRTMFSGIEGLLWFLKVRFLSEEHMHGLLSPHELDALNERAYIVTDSGTLKVAQKFLPITTSIRLVVRLLKRLESSKYEKYKADLSSQGWRDLVEAIKVRNRVVHPKTENDLLVSDRDIRACSSGFGWMVMFNAYAQLSVLEYLERLYGSSRSEDSSSTN